jgi:hypothetical protein
MTVPLQVLDQQFDLFLGVDNLFRRTAEFDLGAATEDLEEGEFLFENVELSIVYTEKLQGVNGFEVDDGFCQRTAFLGSQYGTENDTY